MKRLPLLFLLLAAGCGYRAPLSRTVITEDPEQFVSVREPYRELAALVTSDTGMPPTDSNTVGIVTDQQQKWELMKRDLEGASESVYIDVYRFCPDSCGSIVAGILKEKSAAGADVRVILDKPANAKDRVQLEDLRKDSIDVRMFWFPSWPQDFVIPKLGVHRDHRKIMLVDGSVAYMGGRNIRDAYFLTWRDADVRISGPAVYDLGKVYMENQERVAPELPQIAVSPESSRKAVCDTVPGLKQYPGTTVQIIPESPWDKHLPLRNCFEWAMTHARRYFYFYTPYSPLPQSSLKAMKDAAARGVDVRWIVPLNCDEPVSKWISESLYTELLAAGIRIFEWQGEMIHAKEFVTDDYLLSIGSSNMDNLSFFLNLEVDALVYNEEFAADARKLFVEDAQTRCREVTLEMVRRWNVFRKFRNWLARATVGSCT